ncbi:rhomboid family intramembrane serine protease [Actinorugispora endophytica]
MRDASVGFQCVECVAEGNKGVREARTAFGGKVISKPYVTWALLGLIGVGYLLHLASGGTLWSGRSAVSDQFGMWGAGIDYADQWYRLITSAFLHSGVMHLLFNGFALYVVGPQLENWLGHVRYLALWVVSAVGGSVLGYLVEPNQLTVGASGAIFGLFGAILLIGRRLRLDTRFILGLLAVNLLITFTVPNISWTAHIGGLVSGLLLGGTYAYLPFGAGRGDRTRARAALHAGVTAGYAVVLLAVAVVWAVAVRG